MRKRVALARAVAVRPEIVFYDEPAEGLDPINVTRVNRLLLGLQESLERHLGRRDAQSQGGVCHQRPACAHPRRAGRRDRRSGDLPRIRRPGRTRVHRRSHEESPACKLSSSARSGETSPAHATSFTPRRPACCSTAAFSKAGAPRRIERNRDLGFRARDIDVMVLSHAHIDHSGALPRLYRQGFRGSIYCTPATRDLCAAMLEDSAEIQAQDAAYINARSSANGADMQPVEPLYDQKDVVGTLGLMVSVPYHRPVTDRRGSDAHVLRRRSRARERDGRARRRRGRRTAPPRFLG